MNPSLYYTSVLQYRPSYLLDERVNIGVLFWFLEEGKLVFKYPNRLARLQHLYFDAPLEVIRRYLRGLEKQANSLTKQQADEIHHFDKNLLQKHFLVNDANSFVFGDWQLGVLTVKEQVSTIIERETLKYLRYYYNDEKLVVPHDEEYLKKSFIKSLALSPQQKSFFKERETIVTANVKYEFPYAWQNGTQNMVTPLSFDLKEAQSIQSKAVKWFGLFYQLKTIAEDRNLHFDVLLAKPTHSNLLGAYDSAINILNDAQQFNTRIRRWEESEIDDYAHYVLQNIESYNQEEK